MQVRLSLAEVECIHWNSLSVNEHVFHEKYGGYAFGNPDSSKVLDSISSDPRVAIRYAYGIKLDAPITAPEFYRDTPNKQPGIAVLSHDVKRLKSKGVPNVEGHEEVSRRVERDSEEFLIGRQTPVKVIPLPPFDETNPIESLDKAAAELLKKLT